MKIIVTGTDGYIGALLAPLLLCRRHEVKGIDTGYYREGWLYNNELSNFPPSINKDIRHITEEDLEGFDAIIHLAELSNDPVGMLNPEITYKINYQSAVELAKRSKKVGITRFVYASSCSVYGAGSDEYKTEESEPNPLTAYAKCKVLVERDISSIADNTFSPIFLRYATAYGASPRMRFDIVLNNLAGLAWTTGLIKMTSDGTPWRPLVHVLDICQAILCTLDAPRELVHNQIFNVGETSQNYQIKDVARIVFETFPGCRLEFGSSNGDNRSYRVSFEKINTLLPGFKCKQDVQTGASQLKGLFEKIAMDRETFEFRPYTRLRQLQYLIKTNQIDRNFFWNYR
jgi:nucleoside-diphosphate-sugar epimerase